MLGRAHSDHCQRVAVGVEVVVQDRDGHGRILGGMVRIVRGHRRNVRHCNRHPSLNWLSHLYATDGGSIQNDRARCQAPIDGHWQRDGDVRPRGDRHTACQRGQVVSTLGYGARGSLQRHWPRESQLPRQIVNDEHVSERGPTDVGNRDRVGEALIRTGSEIVCCLGDLKGRPGLESAHVHERRGSQATIGVGAVQKTGVAIKVKGRRLRLVAVAIQVGAILGDSRVLPRVDRGRAQPQADIVVRCAVQIVGAIGVHEARICHEYGGAGRVPPLHQAVADDWRGRGCGGSIIRDLGLGGGSVAPEDTVGQNRVTVEFVAHAPALGARRTGLIPAEGDAGKRGAAGEVEHPTAHGLSAVAAKDDVG